MKQWSDSHVTSSMCHVHVGMMGGGASSVSRGRCGLRKTEKIFSANNEQGTIKRGEKWFPEKL